MKPVDTTAYICNKIIIQTDLINQNWLFAFACGYLHVVSCVKCLELF